MEAALFTSESYEEHNSSILNFIAQPMEAIKTIHVCRVCLKEDKNLQSIDLSVFEFCTGISLTGREYSSNICAECEKFLSDVNEFKKRCINNDRVIDDLFRATVNATEVKVEILETFADPINVFTVKEEELDEEFSINEEMDDEVSDDEVTPSVKPKKKRKSSTKQSKLDGKPKKKREQLGEKKEQSQLCPHCGKLILKRSLRKHLMSHNTDPVKQYPCDLCDKTFTIKSNVLRHKQSVHEKEKKYPCELCDKVFVHCSTRQRHVGNFHNAIEKTHVCNICDKKFLIKSELDRHMSGHTQEKPHKCEICLMCFRLRTQLNSHLRTHNNEKNFLCKTCEKSYPTKIGLAIHERIHTGFKDYMCPVCSKEFMQNHVMRNHCRSTHPEYELPPPGTIMSQSYLRKMKAAETVSEVS